MRLRGLAEKRSRTRLVATSALLSLLVLTPLTYTADAAGGHPARSAPLILWIAWTLLVLAARLLWRGARALARRVHAEAAPASREGAADRGDV